MEFWTIQPYSRLKLRFLRDIWRETSICCFLLLPQRCSRRCVQGINSYRLNYLFSTFGLSMIIYEIGILLDRVGNLHCFCTKGKPHFKFIDQFNLKNLFLLQDSRHSCEEVDNCLKIISEEYILHQKVYFRNDW